MSAIDDIAAERRRQIEAEGWTPEHDDEHANDEMAMAAVCYADPNPPLVPDPLGEVRGFPAGWPWDYRWWKPKDRRRNLVRAAALLAAEIDRYDRLLRRLVSEALQNAAANGVDFVGWTDEAIATDMLTYDADLEDADHAAVTALVRELRNGAAA